MPTSTQRPTVLLDRSATLAKAVQCVAEAAAAGASLIVFPESFIPGYPSWIWHLAAGKNGAVMGQLHARLLANAVDIGGGDLAPLCEAARAHDVTVVCGLNERDRALSGRTLYNSVVVIGSDGSVQNRHRKLMPTNPERMVHGLGDAAGLRVVATPADRIQTCSQTPSNGSTTATRWSSIRWARSLRARCAARPACCTRRSMWGVLRRHAERSTSPGTTRAGHLRAAGAPHAAGAVRFVDG